MKKLLFPFILILLFSITTTTANAEIANSKNSTEFIQLLNKSLNKNSVKHIKKKKLKKVVRKAGRVYRSVKQDRNSKKKSRRVQRTAKMIINIF